jgi:hypothetical protein
MSIGTIVSQDKSFKGLTMRYEDGGKVQVFRLGDKEVRLGPTASDGEVIAAFKEPK